MLGRITRLIPTRAALWAALVAAGAISLAWLRRDAARDAHNRSELEDLRHADDIEDRVARNRTDPGRLRKYEDSGWRD